ncbi:transposase family protein [Streptomyces fulvoviolaceus]|uniref:transposase family protein n=1 Tax=Streptomyces fulvoviolaceus TaxID=285535 RepID=UPI001F1B7585|nr:transposase family protein [Streptomyces fulvoviolaceus]
MRHRLTVVLALTACAVPAGATSLPAVGEWIADAPGYLLEQVGAVPDPLLPRRVLPAETTVRRLPARIDGDAPGGGRTMARRPPPENDRAARPRSGRQEPAWHGQGDGPQDPPARRTGARHQPDRRAGHSGSARRQRTPRDGHLAQPRHRSPPHSRSEEHRGRPPPQRPRPSPPPRTPRPHVITKQASHNYAEALTVEWLRLCWRSRSLIHPRSTGMIRLD